jgi:hypothetical protein
MTTTQTAAPSSRMSVIIPTRNEGDPVIGCRMRGGSDEFAGTWTMCIRLWGNNVLTQVTNTRHGVSLADS